jgi:hypothetical protein
VLTADCRPPWFCTFNILPFSVLGFALGGGLGIGLGNAGDIDIGSESTTTSKGFCLLFSGFCMLESVDESSLNPPFSLSRTVLNLALGPMWTGLGFRDER